MSNEKSHFPARKIQRSTFLQEPEIWEHAKRSHAESFEYDDALTRDAPPTLYNPLKHGAGENSRLPEPPPYGHNVGKITSRAHHTKALSGGPFVRKDPDFDRKAQLALQ